MTLVEATSLIAFISYGGLLALVFRYGLTRSRYGLLFSLYLFDMLLLQAVYLMLSLANSQQEALFWYTFTVPITSAQVVIYFFFTKTFLGLEQPRKLVRASILIWLLIVALGTFLNPGVIFTSIHRDQVTDLFVPELGLLGMVLLTPMLWLFSIAVRDLARGYRGKSHLQRVRIQYLLLAILVVWAGMLANAAPSLRPYPLDVAANIASAFLIAYAILRYQLLDVNIIFRKGLVYSVSALIMGTGYFIAILLVTSLFNIWAKSHSLTLSLAVAIAVVGVVTPLRDRAQRWIDRALFREKYDGSLMIQRLSRTATSILDLKQLASMILDDVIGTMHIQWAAILLEQDGGDFHPIVQKGLDAPFHLSLGQGHPVLRWLSSHETIMTADTLNEMLAHNVLSRPQLDELKRIGSELLIPLKARDRLVGVLVVGAKLSQQMYSQDDELVLTTLANQVAVAIDNARLYETVQQELAERKRAEAEREKLIRELEAKNAELEWFTYAVSHDLKSPLVTIRGFLGFLEKDAMAGNLDQFQADLGRITEAADRMQRLLTELLELSRIGHAMSLPQEVPFEAIAREAVELVQGRIQARGVHVEIAPNLPIVHGDRARLVEVVQNLIDNAAKFMGDQPQPCVQIGTCRTDGDGKPVFFVKDNGIGIDPQYHERVFGLFNKLDAHSEGTGIGLTLVKRIIEVHGGRAWIESNGTGQGIIFYFTLPAQAATSNFKGDEGER
jgi:K+-sensing histidine kinase KdpD